ncbi:MAG TPA: hypothetical protein PLA50_15590, partial [Bacteroidia bacterium]|nr:hypothetical protein [Bacteroidia bacterium]
RELLLARPLVHRSSPSLTPTETDDVLTQTAALLNIKDPSILMVSLAGVGERHLHDQLAAYLDHFPNARHRCVETTQDPLTEGIPGRRFEFAASVQETPPTAEEQPFQKELRERWTRQDFFGPDAATAAQMPSRGDLQLLKIGGMVQKVAAVAILAFCGWTGMDFVGKVRSEAWRLSAADADFMEMQLAKLAKERGEWQHWDGLLGKRSEGWLALQTLLEIFPQDGGVILSEARYRAEADDSVKEPEAVGLKRAWEVSGYANPEVAVDLPTLGSRNRVAEVLNGIAERNHAPYLKVGTPTRSLEVAFQQRQGTMQPSATFPANVARHFRTTFDLKISQSLNSQDELAINISPLPGQ